MGEKQDLLAKLRAAKEAKGLSYQDIVEMTEKNGEAVSLSTVRRVLQPDADIEDFRYNQTVRPIVNAVLGIGEVTEEPDAQNSPEQSEQYYTQIEALKAVVAIKNEQLEERAKEMEHLRSEIVSLKAQQKDEISKVETSDQKKVDYLKDIIKDLQGAAKWYKKVIAILGIVVALAMIAVIIDLSIGHVGWIRY